MKNLKRSKKENYCFQNRSKNMEKYLFKSNIFAKLSEIVEADSEKEVMDKIRKQESFEIKQEVLRLYPSSIEIRKIKEKKGETNDKYRND